LSVSCIIADHLSPPVSNNFHCRARLSWCVMYLLKAFTGGFWGKLFLFSSYRLYKNVSYTIA